MKFVPGKPALLIRDALVIADLHIGLEQELHAKGVRLPSLTKRMLSDITALIEQTRAKKLFVLGDLKHRIASLSSQEAKEIPLLLSTLSRLTELRIVLGNHDAGLKPLLEGLEVYGSRGFTYRDHLLFHGHARPLRSDVENASHLVASHWHPVFEFRDSVGGRTTEKMWVEAHAFGKPLLIMPSFNRLLGGVTLNKIDEKWVDLEGAKLTLIDGTYLGEFNRW
ncbi:MAG: metallophosphoesterase [Candidatus Diapherotrites archaeon]|nr:metallophosphoesterase [Candidatus Diapherotrites archaeon]